MSGSSKIAKTATDPGRHAREFLAFANARSGFKAFLEGLGATPNLTALLPAYVGWSPNEGSGVFDPVKQTGVRYRFYRMTRALEIDLEDLEAKLRGTAPAVVLLIHYFGFPDPRLEAAVRLVRAAGALALEDQAHSLFSDWVGGACGRFGDASIFSLHKMFPVRTGGLLSLGSSLPAEVGARIRRNYRPYPLERSPFDYDLAAIHRARRENAMRLLELLAPLERILYPLRPTIPAGVAPQTLPVVIREASRDALYFKLNEAGYGVVSLYHTLVDPIGADEFPDSRWLARRALNLPVHQDVDPEAYPGMLELLERSAS